MLRYTIAVTECTPTLGAEENARRFLVRFSTCVPNSPLRNVQIHFSTCEFPVCFGTVCTCRETITMSSYSPPESSFQQTPNTPQFVHQYPEVPPPNSPRAPVPPGYYSNQDLPSQQTPTQQTSASKANGDQNRSANRLRKACDNCSIRKVKVGFASWSRLPPN